MTWSRNCQRPVLWRWTALIMISMVASDNVAAFSISRLPHGRVFPRHFQSYALYAKDRRHLWDIFVERFQGDFDNYEQVAKDRQLGMEPREGGGHEHIHCSLVPLIGCKTDDGSKKNSRKVLAAFYFDGIPQRIFRFRLYELLQHKDDSIYMKLYTLHPDLEGRIRQSHTETPLEWPRVYSEFVDNNSNEIPSKLLENCDVQWSFNMDPEQHTYMEEQDDKDVVHAVMIHGEALVESQMAPGSKIRVMDQLSLWRNEFWIHDRGFDPETGNFIYGNQRGVPYQMKRVTNILPTCNEIILPDSRQVTSKKLKWTLGPQWRTNDEYQKQMELIGGISTKLNS